MHLQGVKFVVSKTSKKTHQYYYTYNTKFDNSVQIVEKLTKPKDFILTEMPGCNVIFSQLVHSFDDAKAQSTTTIDI